MTVRTSWEARKRPEGAVLGTIVVFIRIVEDDGVFVGHCAPFGVSSFGDSVEAARDATLEAVEVYLEAIDEVGERDKVFADLGVLYFPGEPPAEVEWPTKVHPGEYVTAERVSVA